jgi:NarL family two-component system response regulator LiaR
LNKTATKPIRVLIADDHPPFAEGLSRLIAEQPDLTVVDVARDGEEAVRLTRELKPDVTVLDIAMPKMSGIKAARQIKSELPGTAILVLSAYGYDPYVLSALEAGAAGYLLKNVPMRELLNAIRAVRVGETVLDQTVAEKLLRSLARPSGDAQASTRLSTLELEILKLGAQGLSNKEIGKKMFISERTVQSHFTTIFQKLEVGSRIEAVLHALKEGWLTIDDIA